MSELQDILSQIPIDQIATELGVDPATAQSAVQHVVPALLSGLQANAADPAGAASLAGALGEHDPNLLDGGVDISGLDTAGGAQIVQNIFGGNTDAVVNQLGGLPLGGRSGGLGGALIGKLLPILAPIVLSYLAKRIFGSGGLGTGGGAAVDSPAGGGVVADSSTGGGSMAPGGGVDTGPSSAQAPAQSNGQDAGPGAGGVSITDILGQILGGAAGGSAGSAGANSAGGNSAGQIDIGSILGDLLGGGKR